MLSGVPNRVTGQPLLASHHELFGPRVVGVGLDPLPPAQVVDCDLAAEALQNNSDLLFRGVLTSGSRLHCADERPGLLAFVPRQPLLCLLLIGTHLLLSVGSSTLISGAHTTLRLSGFPTLICVPLSLTVYSYQSILVSPPQAKGPQRAGHPYKVDPISWTLLEQC